MQNKDVIGRKKYKILYIITLGILGGAQTHIRHLAMHLKDRFEVHVAIGVKGPLWEQLEELGVYVHHIPNLMREISVIDDLKAVFQTVALLKKIHPDIISTHSSKAGIIGRIAARICSIPVIFTAHGWAFTDGVPERQRKKYILAERLASHLAKKVICVSQHDRDIALENGVGEPQQLVAINNGMPVMPELPLASPEKNNPVRLIMVARFSEQKDHQLLLNALSRIKNKNYQVDLIGDGPLINDCSELAKNLGLEEKVNFLGERTDVPKLLTRYQAFLLVSKWEGFPRSIIEAMRAGLPVLVSNVGGSNEAVIDGVTGYLVPRGDLSLLVERLEVLITDNNLRARMGQKGNERFKKLFTFDYMLDKTVQVYMQALDKR